jgi:hypothetical protein
MGENNTKISSARAEPKLPGANGAKPLPAPVATTRARPRVRPESLSSAFEMGLAWDRGG